MEPYEPSTPSRQPSRRLLWISLAVVAVVTIGVVGMLLAVLTNTKKESTVSTTSSVASSNSVATKEQVAQSAATLEQSRKQAEADRAAAKAALTYKQNTIKVNN